MKTIKILFLAFVAMLAVSCDKNESNGTSGVEKDYYYNLYTETQNLDQSNFDAFDPLWDVNDAGEPVVWMRMIHSTREDADRQAVEAFNEMLSQINDAEACQGLHGDDYMLAIMQRVEGGPHDLASKKWTSNGVE